MKRFLAIALIATTFAILCGNITAQVRTAKPDNEFTVSRFGGYTLSRNITSIWLAGPDHRPRLMVYFSGPDDWHRTLWSMDSKFEKGKPGWAELRSDVATLHFEVDPEIGQVGVQLEKFNIRASNTFLVLHMGELLAPHRIIPLGVFELPTSDNRPASLLLLDAHPELKERIDKETRADYLNTETPNRRPSLEEPCSETRINLLQKNTTWKFQRAFLITPDITARKSLEVPYAIPCWHDSEGYGRWEF